jgi:hypothetical protein
LKGVQFNLFHNKCAGVFVTINVRNVWAEDVIKRGRLDEKDKGGEGTSFKEKKVLH